MKISTGAVAGVLVGLVMGVLTGVVGYLAILAIEEEFREFIKSSVVGVGGSPEVAEQAAVYVMQWLPISTIVGSLVFGVLFYFVVGVIMAVAWDRLKTPWYGMGAIFAVAILAISAILSLVFAPPPGTPKTPPIYNLASAVLTFAGPMLLAWLLHKKTSK